jgi:hypothetical protein
MRPSELIAIESRSFRGLLPRNPFLALELAKSLAEPKPRARP